MMALIMHESIKSILGDVDNFLQETLKKENLSKSCKEQRQSLVDKIVKIWDDYPQLAPEDKVKTDVDKNDESSRTGGSSTTDDGEDPYSEQKFPDLAAQDVKDEVIAGYLEKKQKKGHLLSAPKFQKRWCVVKEDRFYYYEGKKDKKQRGAFCISGYTFQPSPDIVKETNKKELCFELVCQGKRPYQFMALNADDFRNWKNALQKASSTQTVDDDEDIYEPIGVEEDVKRTPPPPPPKVVTAPDDDQEEYADTANPDEDDDQDIYDDTAPEADNSSDGPPPPPPMRGTPPAPPGRKALPPTPSSSTPPPPPDRKIRSEPPPPPKREDKPDGPEVKKRKIVNPKEDFENLYYGKWDFTGGTGDELTFEKGALIHIISKEFDKKSWWVGELQGKYGLVPKQHLTPAYETATA